MPVLPEEDLINEVELMTVVQDTYGDKKLTGTSKTVKCRVDLGNINQGWPSGSTSSQNGQFVSFDGVIHVNGNCLEGDMIIKYGQVYYTIHQLNTIQDLETSEIYQFAMLLRNDNVTSPV